MKIRGMKQVLHWIFLIVGVFSLIVMGITMDTYLGYAEEGYGLDMSFDSAYLNDDWLVLNFYFVNPGGLDIELLGGNLTMSEIYDIPTTILPNHVAQEYPLSPLPAHENVSVMIWIPITNSADLDNIRASGQVELDLDLLLFVPERYMNTHITFQAIVEVSV